MKRHLIGKCLLTGMLIGTSAAAYAVPAKPGLVNFTQKDGETLKVRLVGDENFHFYFTEDGYPLVENAGTLYYCTLEADGTLKDSGFGATVPEKRTSEVRQWLERVDRKEIETGLQVWRGKSMTMRKGPFRGTGPNARLTPYPQGAGVCPGTTFPAYGDQKVLVVLVEFKDVKYRVETPDKYFQRMLNEPGFSDYGATGSAKDYFEESSAGIFTPDFDVYGPVTLSQNMDYYGGNDWAGNDQHPAEMIAEACRMLDDKVDFSEYDRDGDGYVDNIYVYYAGLSEASGGGTDCVWPHAWFISAATEMPVLDGVKLDRYACSNEWTDEAPCGIGTFVHEFSHVLGLPDLYSTSYTGAFTPGEWSAMDVGPYNNEGRTPPLFSAFERYALGWINPVEITGARNVVLPSIGNNVAALIRTSSENEYFIIENRQKKSWDTYIPGHGMLVWHIDYDPQVWTDNRVNNLPYHQYIDIEEADGDPSYTSIGGDAFPGDKGITSFTDYTNPSMKTWTGLSMTLPITEITEDENGLIRFKVRDGGSPLPAVAALPASDVTADGFTACWNNAGEGYGYLLSAGKEDSDGKVIYLPGLRYRNVGSDVAFRVDGLAGETKYFYTVMATDGLDYGPESDRIYVTTDVRTLAYETAEASGARDVTKDSFTATWLPTEGATEYLLTVYTKEAGDPLEDLCDFSDGAGNLPEGWSSSSSQGYSMASYCGESVPSLRLALDGDMLTTPEYPDGVKAFSFWHRGNSSSPEDMIELYALTGEEWRLVSTHKVISEKGGETIRTETLPDGTTAMRIVYSRAGDKGSLAIDDVKVSYGHSLVPVMLAAFDRFNAGDNLSAHVGELKPSTTYFYIVNATDGTFVSRPSAEVTVTTADDSGVKEQYASDGLIISGNLASITSGDLIEVYDAAGNLLAERRGKVTVPGKGLRIIRIPALGISRKIVIR